MLIQKEEDILNEAVRRTVIKEIQGAENKARKAEAFKRYECLKDKTETYVLALLNCQFSQSTVQEMQYAITNVSFARKVIDKLARVYSNGVKRTLPKDQEQYQADLDIAAKLLKMNTAMKKWNRYFKAFRNALAYTKPFPMEDGKLGIEVNILPPFLYDVIPQPGNPKGMLAVILSDYAPQRNSLYALGDAAVAGRTGITQVRLMSTDGKDEAIADGDDARVQSIDGMGALMTKGKQPEKAPDDDGLRYIWWTGNYHFTTNGKGKILETGSDGDVKNSNPISELPFVNLAEDQDEQFWAEGGKDIADSSIKINAFITNLIHIAVTQGYGQLVVSGKDLPKSIRVGPNHAIMLEQENKDEPTSDAKFISATPPVADLLSLVEMYVALMLSTNNLSSKGMSVSLQGSSDFPSGIAMIIDKSESMEDVQEQSEYFIEAEPEVWAKIEAWHKILKSKGVLSDSLAELTLPEDPEVQVAFTPQAPIVSEKEKLEAIQMRLDMKLMTQVEALMRDDPSLTEETAKEKLKKILEEKIADAAQAAASAGTLGATGQWKENWAAVPGQDAGAPGQPGAGAPPPAPKQEQIPPPPAN